VRPARARRLLAVSTALAALGAGCTWIVDFVDQAACDGGICDDATAPVSDASLDDGGDARADARAGDADPCESLADGAACGNADPCNERPTCASGRCVHHPNDAAAFCAYLGGCNCGYCNNGACSTTKKCPEGFNWEAGDDLARCCGGLPVRTNTNANCGVCGVVCKTAGVSTPQDCQMLGGHYLCVGCASNTECWSQCCSSAPTPSHCAASDCNTGACPNGICPSPAKCVMGANNNPNYCSY
jgi:hypothetical protein